MRKLRLLFVFFLLLTLTSPIIQAQDTDNLLIIDDFEQGLPIVVDEDNGMWLGYVPFGDTSNNVTLSATQVLNSSELVTPDQGAANTVLTISHRIGVYGGFIHLFNDGDTWISQDWSGYHALRFWLYGSRTGGQVMIEILDNRASNSTGDTAERFFVRISDNFSGWQSFTIPLGDFQRRTDFQPQGAPDDGLGLTEVYGYAFSFPATGRPVTTHLDNVTVVTETFIQQEAEEIAQEIPMGEFKLVWSDEFDGEAGTSPDQSKWGYNVGGDGWGNQEHQFYTARPENVTHDGQGNLVITALDSVLDGASCWYGECKYSSARLVTQNKFAFTYGRVEGRLKIPFGQGIWPAFWMLGTDISTVGWPRSGEIDIMENIGREPRTVHGTVHGPGYSGGQGVTGGLDLPNPLSDDFHVYAIEWDPEEIRWYIDDTQYFKITPDSLRGNRWVFDHDFFIILNVAVGGLWPGYPDDTTTFPQKMLIDYVRVYQRSEE